MWPPLFAIVGATLVVANFGSGMGAQLGAARLLFGMGRSNALPKSFFRGRRSQEAHSAQQRDLRGGGEPGRGLHDKLRPWARKC
jgi:hypothetical protein